LKGFRIIRLQESPAARAGPMAAFVIS